MKCLAIFSAAALGLSLTQVTANKQILPPTTDSTYIVTGAIQGLESGWVYLRHSETSKIDSVKASGGRFLFKGIAAHPEYCQLGVAGASGRPELLVQFFLEKGVLQVSARKDTMQNAVISGTPTQDEFVQYLNKQKTLVNWELYDKQYTIAKGKNDQTQLDSLRKAGQEMSNRERQIAKEYAKQHPDSYVSVLEIDINFSYDPDAVQLEEVYGGLSPAIQDSYLGRNVKAVLDATKKTAVGNPAPGFTQTDINGKPVALSSFKGKYVLIDFWASWCGPCRLENPALLKAYKAYRSKGFTVLGVSLDNKKDKWIEAIKKDGLNWTQVSDLQGWKNSVAIQYGIRGIPMNFLLDKDGQIVAKGLRGEELEKKLAELVH